VIFPVQGWKHLYHGIGEFRGRRLVDRGVQAQFRNEIRSGSPLAGRTNRHLRNLPCA
jgi:hypothetical protein